MPPKGKKTVAAKKPTGVTKPRAAASRTTRATSKAAGATEGEAAKSDGRKRGSDSPDDGHASKKVKKDDELLELVARAMSSARGVVTDVRVKEELNKRGLALDGDRYDRALALVNSLFSPEDEDEAAKEEQEKAKESTIDLTKDAEQPIATTEQHEPLSKTPKPKRKRKDIVEDTESPKDVDAAGDKGKEKEPESSPAFESLKKTVPARGEKPAFPAKKLPTPPKLPAPAADTDNEEGGSVDKLPAKPTEITDEEGDSIFTPLKLTLEQLESKAGGACTVWKKLFPHWQGQYRPGHNPSLAKGFNDSQWQDIKIVYSAIAAVTWTRSDLHAVVDFPALMSYPAAENWAAAREARYELLERHYYPVQGGRRVMVPWTFQVSDPRGAFAHTILLEAVPWDDIKDEQGNSEELKARGEQFGWVIRSYDSSINITVPPRVLNTTMRRFRDMLIDIGWFQHIGHGFTASNLPVAPTKVTVQVPQQEASAHCGVFTVLNAWCLALGLDIDPHGTMSKAFIKACVEVLNLVLTGEMDAASLYEFLRCKKYIMSYSRFDARRNFDRTLDMTTRDVYDGKEGRADTPPPRVQNGLNQRFIDHSTAMGVHFLSHLPETDDAKTAKGDTSSKDPKDKSKKDDDSSPGGSGGSVGDKTSSSGEGSSSAGANTPSSDQSQNFIPDTPEGILNTPSDKTNEPVVIQDTPSTPSTGDVTMEHTDESPEGLPVYTPRHLTLEELQSPLSGEGVAYVEIFDDANAYYDDDYSKRHKPRIAHIPSYANDLNTDAVFAPILSVLWKLRHRVTVLCPYAMDTWPQAKGDDGLATNIVIRNDTMSGLMAGHEDVCGTDTAVPCVGPGKMAVIPWNYGPSDAAHWIVFLAEAIPHADREEGKPQWLLRICNSMPKYSTDAELSAEVVKVRHMLAQQQWFEMVGIDGDLDNLPDMPEILNLVGPEQTAAWSGNQCGLYAILYAWCMSLGLTPSEQQPTDPKAMMKKTIEVANKAMTGNMDSATIFMFLRAYGFIDEDEQFDPNCYVKETINLTQDADPWQRPKGGLKNSKNEPDPYFDGMQNLHFELVLQACQQYPNCLPATYRASLPGASTATPDGDTTETSQTDLGTDLSLSAATDSPSSGIASSSSAAATNDATGSSGASSGSKRPSDSEASGSAAKKVKFSLPDETDDDQGEDDEDEDEDEDEDQDDDGDDDDEDDGDDDDGDDDDGDDEDGAEATYTPLNHTIDVVNGHTAASILDPDVVERITEEQKARGPAPEKVVKARIDAALIAEIKITSESPRATINAADKCEVYDLLKHYKVTSYNPGHKPRIPWMPTYASNLSNDTVIAAVNSVLWKMSDSLTVIDYDTLSAFAQPTETMDAAVMATSWGVTQAIKGHEDVIGYQTAFPCVGAKSRIIIPWPYTSKVGKVGHFITFVVNAVPLHRRVSGEPQFTVHYYDSRHGVPSTGPAIIRAQAVKMRDMLVHLGWFELMGLEGDKDHLPRFDAPVWIESPQQNAAAGGNHCGLYTILNCWCAALGLTTRGRNALGDDRGRFLKIAIQMANYAMTGNMDPATIFMFLRSHHYIWANNQFDEEKYFESTYNVTVKADAWSKPPSSPSRTRMDEEELSGLREVFLEILTDAMFDETALPATYRAMIPAVP